MNNEAPHIPPKPKKRVLEKDVEKEVCDYARHTFGMLTYKFVSPGHAGVPDRIIINREGIVTFWEFKAPRKGLNVSPVQRRELDALSSRGCVCFVCDHADHGKKLIDLLADSPRFIEWWTEHFANREPAQAPTPVDDRPRIVMPASVPEKGH